jgi:hypothetical protein
MFQKHKTVDTLYPGLNSLYKIHKVPIKIDKANFKLGGYLEDQPKKISYFVWEEVSN